MGGYIGATAVGLVTTAADVQGDITSTDTTPELILKNTSEEDTEGGREGKITFKGEQSGGEESTLAEIQGSHDGTADDEKGDLIFKTNDGSDGASPTEAMRINSDQNISIPDNGKVMFGTGSDLQIYHDGSNSFIDDAATGNLQIRGTQVKLQKYTGENMFVGVSDGAASMYYDNSQKIATTSTGVDVTGSLEVAGDNNAGAKANYIRITDTDTTATAANQQGGIEFYASDSSAGAGVTASIEVVYAGSGGGGEITFNTAANSGAGVSEAARLDSSGNLLVGKTVQSIGTDGVTIVNGQITATSDGADAIRLNRKTSDGSIIDLRKDGSTVGSIGSISGDIYAGTGDTNLRYNDGGDDIRPASGSGAGRDNLIDLGDGAARFDDVYATNGTIQTSDENEKQNIASLTSAEITAATAISKLFKTFKWKDKVAAKGDNARTHTGVIAQDVEQAMTDAGLDAGNYAFFISTTWWEKDVEVAAVEADEENGIEAKAAYTRTDSYETADEAPEGATERNRKGIRYPELLSFIGAATEQRLTSIEARLTALEG